MQVCIRCYITGKVQGVWFRASTQKEANKLGITGWAKNLPDGRVEVVACGTEEQINQLKQWLRHGPDLARVDDFSYEEIAWQEHEEFRTL